MNLTITKIKYMHFQCTDKECPICSNDSLEEIDKYIRSRVTVQNSGSPYSPWWYVEEDTRECYRALRGNLRPKGFYDR